MVNPVFFPQQIHLLQSFDLSLLRITKLCLLTLLAGHWQLERSMAFRGVLLFLSALVFTALALS
jgi:hypothetical protein